MTYTFLFVIALICVSGFIAYFGDLLGRKMGKKRLTLFGLRPRHTAIMVTTITGMLISTLALVTLVSVNSQFRKVLTKGEQILAQNKQLSTANMELAKRGKGLRVQVARQQKELAGALKDAILAKKQRDSARLRVDSLRQDIAARQKELIDLRKRRDITESELAQRKDELELTMAKLETADQSLLRAQSKLADAQQKLGATEARLKDTQDKLAEAEKAFADWSKVTDTAADYLLKQRLYELAFRQGDELARGIIKPAQSDFALKGDLYSLLERASKKAVEGGAKVGENGRAVGVIYRQMTDKEHALFIDDESKCIDMAIKQIASGKSDVLVQVVCGMNTIANAQVPVELRLYVNELVFQKDGKIAETKIDGRESEGYILLALSNFLQTDVAKIAARAGVVPVSGQDPRSALGPNRQAQADELLRVVSEVKSMNAVADVSVYATSSIYTADSLNMANIRFGAKKAE